MNYKFLSLLATFVAYMFTGAGSAHATTNEQQKVAVSPLKIGYVDVAYIFENCAEAKSKVMDMRSFQQQLEKHIQEKYKQLQEKAADVQERIDSLTEAQKKQKIAEVNALQVELQKLEEEKYVKMEGKHREVIKPFQDRMQEAIAHIATKQNYALILAKNTESGPILLFGQPALDISTLVLARLKEMVQVAPVPVVGPKKQVETAGQKMGKKKK